MAEAAGGVPDFVSRIERFDRVDSTQAVARGWLEAGSDEICVAVADVQSDGRGRLDRIWQDRPGGSLLVSVGFRPTGISAGHAWRLPAIASRLAPTIAANEHDRPIERSHAVPELDFGA